MEIQLTRGMKCKVSPSDRWVGQFKWCASKANGGYYAVRGVWNPFTKKTAVMAMHRLIMDAKSGEVVDHINGDTLDNRHSNLRICTNAENIRKMTKESRGVHFVKARAHLPNPWQAYIGSAASTVTPRRYLGYYSTKKEAQAAYNAAAKAQFGRFFTPPKTIKRRKNGHTKEKDEA